MTALTAATDPRLGARSLLGSKRLATDQGAIRGPVWLSGSTIRAAAASFRPDSEHVAGRVLVNMTKGVVSWSLTHHHKS
jgi:hypothetical protein